jgi:hypothetical protein
MVPSLIFDGAACRTRPGPMLPDACPGRPLQALPATEMGEHQQQQAT